MTSVRSSSSSISNKYFVEVALFHPLDVVKTRMQLQREQAHNGHGYYTSILDCFTKIYKQEGFKANWKGIMPRLMMEIPKRSVKFLIFEQSLLKFQLGRPNPHTWSYVWAGATAGIVEGLFSSSIEVIKVHQQADTKNNLKARQVALSLYRQHGYGPNGLGKGLLVTALRNSVFNMVYFGFYHNVKDASPPFEETVWAVLRKLSIGFTSAILATFCSNPFDMVKSRLQAQLPTDGKLKYQGTFNTFAKIYNEEGFRAFFKGLLPRLLLNGPAGAIILIGYEYIYAYLIRE